MPLHEGRDPLPPEFEARLHALQPAARFERLDLTDEAACRAAVDNTVAALGRIDALVNNAGYGSYGAIEDVPISEARR